MINFVQLLLITGIIALVTVLSFLSYFLWRSERKSDSICFLFGDAIALFFILFLSFCNIEQFPSLLSSLVIAELTLALVWVELSKRPELKLGDFVPIIWKTVTPNEVQYKAGYHDEEPKPSRFLGIREVSHSDLKFDSQFSFSVDSANIGYTEIGVHEYVIYIDGKRQLPIPLWSGPNEERLRLIAQERHTIDILPLHIESSGFHKIRIRVSATTLERSKEVWFFISEDLKKLRYVRMYPLKRLLSPLIKAELKDP